MNRHTNDYGGVVNLAIGTVLVILFIIIAAMAVNVGSDIADAIRSVLP